jgi:hypothetical protein
VEQSRLTSPGEISERKAGTDSKIISPSQGIFRDLDTRCRLIHVGDILLNQMNHSAYEFTTRLVFAVIPEHIFVAFFTGNLDNRFDQRGLAIIEHSLASLPVCFGEGSLPKRRIVTFLDEV